MGTRPFHPEAFMDPTERTFHALIEKVVDENLTKAQMLEVYDQLFADLTTKGTLEHGGSCDCRERFAALRSRLIQVYDSILTASVIDELYRRKIQK